LSETAALAYHIKGRRPMRGKAFRSLVALLAVLALVASACGDDDDAATTTQAATTTEAAATTEGATTTEAAATTEARGEPSVITFAFSPDPVIDWLADTGILAEMEEEWNVRLEMTESWDEFTFFAGGHGQIVSMASYDLPLLEQETGIDTVTFGKYNYNRLPILVRGDSPYETLEDLLGEKVAVGSVASSTLIWGVLAKLIYDVDFLFEGGDYEVVLSDHAVNPELVARGEVAACVCIPEFAAPMLRSGELRVIPEYGAPFELYQEYVDPDHKGVAINIFAAEKEWYDAHPYEVQFFLALWEEGIRQWQENKTEIIATYPEHFSVEEPEDVEFIQQYLEDHDWFVETVYLTDEWVQGEVGMFDLMKETGFMEQDAEYPEFDVVAPDPSLP
jgi:ABC-type phosphate/phosphonate transport system substrate-binding protein